MITGGTVKKVSAERLKDKNEGNIRMELNIQIKDVKFDKSKVTVSYTYEIMYQPEFAKMTLEGEVYMDENEKDAKALKEYWEKRGSLPEKTAGDLLTALNYTSAAVGTLLAFAINVNAPINSPRPQINAAAPETKPAA